MVNGATKIGPGIRSVDKDGDHPPPKKLLKLSSSSLTSGSVTVSQVVVSPIQVFNTSGGGSMQATNGGLATIELSNANGKWTIIGRI